MEYNTLVQTPIFNSIINNFENDSDKINFSRAVGMLDHLYLISEPGTYLWEEILSEHASYLSSEIIETFDVDEWEYVSQGPNLYIKSSMIKREDCFLTEGFMREYSDKLDWNSLFSNFKLPKSIIDEFSGSVDWSKISCLNNLSDDFVEEFSGFLHWEAISEYRHLSEDFIRKFEEYVEWDLISGNQDLSEPFILEFTHRIDFKALLQSRYRPDDEFIAYLLTRAYQ
jgi:hypothetical protein